MNNSTAMNITTTPLLNKDINIAEICLFSLNVLFGLPTHSYVIWLIITGTGNGITSEFFLLNLSVCEILICLDCLLFVLSKCFLGFILLALFLQGLIITGRPLFECLICVERYLAVVHPVTFLKYKPLRYRLMCSAVSWIFCCGSCLFCLFTLLSFNTTAHALFFVVVFFLLLSIELFCCAAVLRALKQSGPGERGREREEENHMKKRAFHLILITTVSMVLMYVSSIITGIFTIVKQTYISELWISSLIFYGLGGFLQPVLYLRRCGKLSCCTSS